MKRLIRVLILVGSALVAGPSHAFSLDAAVTGKLPPGVPPDRTIVYLEGVPFQGKLEPVEEKIDQKQLRFLPQVLAIPVGSTVSFLNNDTVTHNVFGVGVETFNLGNWSAGEVRKKKFTKAGEVAILCNLHPEMSAYIMVFDHPFFTRPDPAGNFTIHPVPPGEYRIIFYQPGQKSIEKKVHVPAR